MSIDVGGCLTPHVGLAEPGAEVTTVPLVMNGRRLVVNANISESGVNSARGFVLNHTFPGGSLRVEILDAATKAPIPGFGLNDSVAVKGDSARYAMGWRQSGLDVSS